jgi:WD40 repeat protein
MSQRSGSDSSSTNSGDDLSGCETPVVRDHTLLRRIGKGSYGDVWLAKNSTGVFRAVKIVYRRAFQDHRPFEREFSGIQKFEPVSRTHEGFIDVLQVGINEDEEYFYYVMELGDDEAAGQHIDPATYSPNTLSKVMRKRSRLPVAECLPLALTLSRALIELHKHKLVHRDIKPSNIIFVNGSPKLADIGLVAPVDEARSYVGTEGFIPPEGPGTPQADIYSLGKVLYEIGTGRDRHDFPDLPNLNELTDRDEFLEFNEIIIRACNGNAQQRYQSAAELHADLLLLENGKSVRRLHTLERRWMAFKRTATFVGIIGVVAAAIGYGVYAQWRRSEEQRQRQVGAEIAYGNAAMESGDYLGALPHFTTALTLDNPKGAHRRMHELRIGSLLQRSPKLTHFLTRKQPVVDAQFSPNGQWAAFVEDGGRAYLYNLKTRNISEPFGPKGNFAIGFSPDSSRVAIASREQCCSIFNVSNLTNDTRLAHPGVVFSARFSADGRQVLTACGDGVARLWDVESGKVVQHWGHGRALRSASFSHNGKFVATGSEDHTARLWDISGAGPIFEFPHGGYVNDVAFSPDDKRLITASGADHKARVWDLATGRQIFPELTHLDVVQSAEFSPDGTMILTGSLDGTARIWRADTYASIAENSILKNSDRLNQARFDSTGRKIVIAGNDGSVRIWDFSDCTNAPQPTRTIYSGDGNVVAKIDDDGIQIRRGAEEFTISHTNTESVHFSRLGQALVWRERGSGLVEVWNLSNRKLVAKLNVGKGTLIPSESGRRILRYTGNILQVWTNVAGTTNSLTIEHANDIHSVAFNNAGDAVLVISGPNILLWDATVKKWIVPPIRFKMHVSHAEFSPDGTMIAGCCADGTLAKGFGQVFSAKTGRPISPPLNHGDGVLWISFSADSKRVATASEDFSAAVWDVRTGAQVCGPIVHREKVMTVSFSTDGTMLATISSDQTARIWNTETGDPLTPRFSSTWFHKRPVFTENGLAIANDAGLSQLWPFPAHLPASDDLNALATLLSASNAKLAAPASVAAPRTDSQWEKLRVRYPDLFTVRSASK